MESEAEIEVRGQLPEIQPLLLESFPGREVRSPLACRLDYDQADPLERLQEQLRTGSLSLSAGLARVEPLPRLLGFVPFLPHRPLQQRPQA